MNNTKRQVEFILEKIRLAKGNNLDEISQDRLQLIKKSKHHHRKLQAIIESIHPNDLEAIEKLMYQELYSVVVAEIILEDRRKQREIITEHLSKLEKSFQSKGEFSRSYGVRKAIESIKKLKL